MKNLQDNPSSFTSILTLIKSVKEWVIRTMNTETIDLYWQIGKEVSEMVKNVGCDKFVVQELADTTTSNLGYIRDFSKNIEEAILCELVRKHSECVAWQSKFQNMRVGAVCKVDLSLKLAHYYKVKVIMKE